MWRDLVTLGRDQQAALKTPTSPGIARKLQTRQDAAKFVDRKRDAVRAGFPVMPSALGDLKILRSDRDRPCHGAASHAQAISKLGAVIRVMAAVLTMYG